MIFCLKDAKKLKKTLTVVALGALLLAGCTAAKDEPGPAASSPDPTTEAPVEQVAEVNHQWVQDLWVYETVSTINESGTTVELTEKILAELETRQGEEHDLPDGASFMVYADLKPSVTGADGQPRTDVDVVAGVLTADGAQGLAILGTPTPDADAPIGVADNVQFDLTFLDELTPGDPVLVDFAFLQTFAGPAPEGLTQVQLLQHRLETGQTQYYGDADGVGVYEAHLGEAVAGSTRASVPAKAGPMIDGFDEAVGKCKGGLKCVSDFFDTFEGGVADSMTLIDCNLAVIDCTRKPDPYEPPLVCVKGGKCTEVKGDPHIVDLADNGFDMQGVGEFVALREGGFEVQVRTTPWQESRTVSVLSGVAVRTDGATVTIENPGSGLRAVIDGQEVDLDVEGSETDVGGARLKTFRNALQLTSASGETVTVSGGSGVSMILWVSVNEQAAPAGMFAGAAGKSGSVESADGTSLPLDGSPEGFYGTFVDSWRVTDDDSLFTYATGQSTADHTDQSFPDEIVTLRTLTKEQRARGIAVCTKAGIVSKQVLADCVFDFAVTGSMGFVRDARFADLMDGISTGRVQIKPTTGASVEPEATEPEEVDPTVIDLWHATATPHQPDEMVLYECPAWGEFATVWGGDDGIYTNDSSVCTAAVHQGVITRERGGTVQIETTMGLDDYGLGTTKNGVTTRDWEKAWSGSYIINPDPQ